jgi:hypothetical protein
MIYKKYVHDTRQSECDEDDRERTSSMKDTSSHSVQEAMSKIRQTENSMRDSADEESTRSIKHHLINRHEQRE